MCADSFIIITMLNKPPSPMWSPTGQRGVDGRHSPPGVQGQKGQKGKPGESNAAKPGESNAAKV